MFNICIMPYQYRNCGAGLTNLCWFRSPPPPKKKKKRVPLSIPYVHICVFAKASIVIETIPYESNAMLTPIVRELNRSGST